MKLEQKRCSWAGTTNELMIAYHDKEWGRPVHDDKLLYEFLILEGAQAGLSWSTVLNKRENYRKAYDNFEYTTIAQYDETKITELLQNEGIIRNKLKINSAINNAKRFLQVQQEFGSFDKFIWQFVDFKPLQNNIHKMADVPASTELSLKISKVLKKRKFNFIGTTIMYAFMQAVGMVNDHVQECFCFDEVSKLT